MDIKDVNEILDIPDIENYLRTVFILELYETKDRTIIYSCKLPNNHEIVIDIGSEETLIMGCLDLAEIIVHYDIWYFHWTELNDLDEVISSYHYRPLVNDSDKEY